MGTISKSGSKVTWIWGSLWYLLEQGWHLHEIFASLCDKGAIWMDWMCWHRKINNRGTLVLSHNPSNICHLVELYLQNEFWFRLKKGQNWQRVKHSFWRHFPHILQWRICFLLISLENAFPIIWSLTLFFPPGRFPVAGVPSPRSTHSSSCSQTRPRSIHLKMHLLKNI